MPIGSSFSTSSAAVLDISANGRKVVFVTTTSLDGADGNATGDVYLRDLDANTTTLVSRGYNNVSNQTFGAGGGVANPYGFDGYQGDVVKISADGRYVAYVTDGNHVSGSLGGPPSDFDGAFDVYLRDTLLGRTLQISGFGAEDVQSFDMSADGSRIVFATRDALVTGPNGGDRNDRLDIYLAEIDLAQWATQTAQPGLIDISRVSRNSAGNEIRGGDSFSPVISPDGTRVAFVSNASDMVLADAARNTPERTQLYEINLATGAFREAPALFSLDSAGGTFFSRTAHDLTDDTIVFRDNIVSGDTINVGATVLPPVPGDIGNNGTNTFALSTIRGDVVLSSIGRFDAGDLYDTFDSSFTVTVSGADTGGGTLPDPIVSVVRRNNDGSFTTVATDDDSGINSDAYIRFVNQPPGDYFVRVTGTGTQTGTYTLRFDNFFTTDDITTPVILPLGVEHTDSLFSTTTSDFFKFDANEVNQFRVNLTPTGSNPLTTGIIRIRDGDGDLITQSAAGATSLTVFRSEINDGVGFIEIDSSSDTGSYIVEVESAGLILVPIFPITPLTFDLLG